MNKQQDSCPCVTQNGSRRIRRPGRPVGTPDENELSPGIYELIRHVNLLIKHSRHGNRTKMLDYAAAAGYQDLPNKDQLSRRLGKDAHRGDPPGPEWELCQLIGILCSAPGREDLVLAHLAEYWQRAHGDWPEGWGDSLVEELVDDLDDLPQTPPAEPAPKRHELPPAPPQSAGPAAESAALQDAFDRRLTAAELEELLWSILAMANQAHSRLLDAHDHDLEKRTRFLLAENQRLRLQLVENQREIRQLRAEQAYQSLQPVEPVTGGLPVPDDASDSHPAIPTTMTWQPVDPPPAEDAPAVRDDPKLPDQRSPN